MKLSTVTLSLLLALPLAAQPAAKVDKTVVYGRNVTVTTETTTQTPAVCQAAFDRQIDEQGWHEHIFSSNDSTAAVMIVSQKEIDPCALKSASRVKDLKITMWKASVVNGKTVTETRVYRLSPMEVNDFLDTELPRIATEFRGGTPGRS